MLGSGESGLIPVAAARVLYGEGVRGGGCGRVSSDVTAVAGLRGRSPVGAGFDKVLFEIPKASETILVVCTGLTGDGGGSLLCEFALGTSVQ